MASPEACKRKQGCCWLPVDYWSEPAESVLLTSNLDASNLEQNYASNLEQDYFYVRIYASNDLEQDFTELEIELDHLNVLILNLRLINIRKPYIIENLRKFICTLISP